MKKITLLAILFLSLVFNACEKAEQPGEIPGMGNSKRELEVTPFEFAKGISIVGNITGYGNETIAVNHLKTTSSVEYNSSDYGSGGQYVRLKITVQNEDNENQTTMYFPQGLICKVDNSEYQNGILLQWTWVTLEPGETRTISLDFMCINLGLEGSDASTGYELIGVTDSEVIWDELLNPIGLKKTNIEYYLCKENGKLLADYYTIASTLQDAVWALTNGSGLKDEQKQLINSLQNIEVGMYPQEITTGVALPKSYPEYSPCPGAAEGEIMHQNYGHDEHGQNYPRIDYPIENAYISTLNYEDFILHIYFTTGDNLEINFSRTSSDENFHSQLTHNPVTTASFNDLELTFGSGDVQLQPTGNLFRAVINLNTSNSGEFNCVNGTAVPNIAVYFE